MFLAPIFGSIPPYATGPAIIMVGALMMVSGCITVMCLTLDVSMHARESPGTIGQKQASCPAQTSVCMFMHTVVSNQAGSVP